MLLSVIIPVFNEEEIVAETYRVLEEELKEYEHELIFVNDGSKDKTREIVEGLLPGNPTRRATMAFPSSRMRRKERSWTLPCRRNRLWRNLTY